MTGEMEVYRAAVRTSDGASFPRPRRKPTTQFSEVPESLQQISTSTFDPARRRNICAEVSSRRVSREPSGSLRWTAATDTTARRPMYPARIEPTTPLFLSTVTM